MDQGSYKQMCVFHMREKWTEREEKKVITYKYGITEEVEK